MNTNTSFFFKVDCDITVLFQGNDISRSNSDLRDKILLVLLGILIGTVMSATGYALKWVFNRFQFFIISMNQR